MRLCAWGAAGTQVKWNRQHDYLLATAHGKEVLVWDSRVRGLGDEGLIELIGVERECSGGEYQGT